MEIKVLGPGCSKCKTAYKVVEKVILDNNLDIQLTKVDDIMEMMSYNILSTPAIVINGEVKIKGRVPSEKEIKEARLEPGEEEELKNTRSKFLNNEKIRNCISESIISLSGDGETLKLNLCCECFDRLASLLLLICKNSIFR